MALKFLSLDGSLNAVRVDFMFPASVSNWGAYAISTTLCIVHGKTAAMPERREVEASISAPITAGAFDGYTGGSAQSRLRFAFGQQGGLQPDAGSEPNDPQVFRLRPLRYVSPR